MLRIVLPVAAVGILAFALPRLRWRGSEAHDLPTAWCTADLVQWKSIWTGERGCAESNLILDPQGGFRRAAPIPGPVRVVLIGDSHAKAWLPALDSTFGDLGWNYLAFPASATSPFFVPPGANLGQYAKPDMWSSEKRLELDRVRAAAFATHRPPVVVVGCRWFTHADWNRREFDAGLSNLVALLPDSHFLVIGQAPELPFGDEGFHRTSTDLGRWTNCRELTAIRDARERVHGWIREFAIRNPRVHFLDTAPHYLDGEKVRLHDGRTTLYRDDDHVSVEGAMRLTGVFRDALLECSKAAAPANQRP